MKIAISHSNAEAYNQCEYKFKYATIDKLEPKERSQALQIGTTGHLFFEKFFLEIQQGESIEVATMVGYSAMMDENPKAAVLAMPSVTKWVNTKWRDHLEHVWEIVKVEVTERIELGELGQFPFTIDLVIRFKKTGALYLVDHKFLGQFYSTEVIDLLPQLPKYAAAYESKYGEKIHGAIYNMISTRSNATDESLFKQVRFSISDARKNNAMREQVITFKEIKKLIAGEREPVRSANKMNCGHCGFKQICSAELNGDAAEVEVIKDMLYTENTYGYDYKEELPTSQVCGLK